MAHIIGNKVLYNGMAYTICNIDESGILTATSEADECGFIPTIQGNSEQFSNLMTL